MMIHSGRLRNMASIYIRRDDRLLLLYRQGQSIVKNLWIGSAGGHFNADEVQDARACMLRELEEELNLTHDSLQNISLRYITVRYTDGELRQNYYFFADLKEDMPVTFTSTEGICKWYSLDALADLPMPLTAKCVISHYVQTGQFTDDLYGAFIGNPPQPFVAL